MTYGRLRGSTGTTDASHCLSSSLPTPNILPPDSDDHPLPPRETPYVGGLPPGTLTRPCKSRDVSLSTNSRTDQGSQCVHTLLSDVPFRTNHSKKEGLTTPINTKQTKNSITNQSNLFCFVYDCNFPYKFRLKESRTDTDLKRHLGQIFT